jgi:hypothetical protein
LILNGFDTGEPLAAQMTDAASCGTACFTRIFTVPLDAEIPALEAAGRSLLELNSSSAALKALQGWEATA